MFIGLDLGTSRLRAIEFDERGDRIAWADAPTPIHYAREESVTIDPDRLWATACDLLRRTTRVTPPRAIGVCAQLAFLGIDGAGRPTTPALLWSDVRATTEAADLRERLGADAYALARRRVTPEVLAAKIGWLAVHRPAALARTRHWLSLKDYVVWRLTGEVVTDLTHASYTLLFDVPARSWSPPLVAAASVDPSMLPRLGEAGSLAGFVHDRASRATGAPAGTPVAVGAPDGTAGAVGAGAVRSGVTVDVAGSTDVVFRTTKSADADAEQRLVVNAFALPGLWAVGGPTGLTGGAVSWLARVFGYPDGAALRAGLPATLQEESSGIGFRTELTGARFPTWESSARGAIIGLRPEHEVRHLLRAADEGSAFLVGAGLDVIAEATGRLPRVVVVGGAAALPEGLQLRADSWRRTVTTVREREASALGAAMFGAVAAGSHRSLPEAAAEMVHDAATFVPARTGKGRLARSRAAWERANRGVG